MSAENLAGSRHALSRFRHADGPIRIFALDGVRGTLAPPQPPGWAHLVSLRSGAARVLCAGAQAVATAGVAVWIPDGVPYALNLRAPSDLRIVYAAAHRYPARAPGMFAMTALLRELAERAMRLGYLDPQRATDAHLLAVIEDELRSLRPSGGAPLALPRTPRLRAVLEETAARTDEPPRIGELAARCALSVRTFERRFAHETGLTPREWLRRSRLMSALAALACGASVTEAGLAAGYSSLSAFIAAYRTVFGETPGAAVRGAIEDPPRANGRTFGANHPRTTY